MEMCENVVFQTLPTRGYTTGWCKPIRLFLRRCRRFEYGSSGFRCPHHRRSSARYDATLLKMPTRESHSTMSELTPLAQAAELLTNGAPSTVSAWLGAFWEQERDIALLFLDVDGRIRHAGTAAESLFGYTREELCGMPFGDLYVQNADGTQAAQDLAAARRGAFNDDRCVVRRNGTEFWAIITVSAMNAAAGTPTGFAVSVQDVTTRRRSEEGLRQIVEHSLNAIVLVNQQGVIVSVNAQTENIFGFARRQLIGQPVESLVPERFRRDHPRNRAAFFADPVVRPMGAGRDLYGRRSDGTEFPVEIGLSPVQTVDGPAVLASIVDITERKRAERRFRLAVESAPNANVMINRDGRIVLVNLQTEQLFGYARDELLGQLVEILVPERYRERHAGYRAAFVAMPSVRAMGVGRELYGRRKDGSEFPIEIGLNPIETGEETLVLSAIVDITARKEAEARVRKHLADLAHVARLSTVGQMFSELAHEINQPLAAAANYARACVAFARSSEGATREQLIDWMEKTVAQTARAIEIVKRLGSFVKREGGARSIIGVNALIEQVVALSVPATQTTIDVAPPIELRLDLDPTNPEVLADRVQIEQVLLNLVRNAVEAMQETKGRTHKLTLRSRQQEGFITVSVADTGPGMPPGVLARLFDPYFTTKPTGIGLGLSISRSIVEDHGGRISAEASDTGTTFEFQLPSAKYGTVT